MAMHASPLPGWSPYRRLAGRNRRCLLAEPTIAHAYALTKDFLGVLRERQGHHLDRWLTRAKESGIKELAAKRVRTPQDPA